MKNYDRKVRSLTFSAEYCVAHRDGFQQYFRERLAREASESSRVLDIGCGSRPPTCLQSIYNKLGVVDGVDPCISIHSHPHLRRRWRAEFQDARIPGNYYDWAFAFNVMEHVANPESFFKKLRAVLKPGGSFYALTPHWQHPFPWMVRFVERLNAKKIFATAATRWGNYGVNEYPAFYRANTRRAVAEFAEAGFTEPEFINLPCRNWDTYFPWFLRPLPAIYDVMVGDRREWGMLIFIYKLQAV